MSIRTWSANSRPDTHKLSVVQLLLLLLPTSFLQELPQDPEPMNALKEVLMLLLPPGMVPP